MSNGPGAPGERGKTNKSKSKSKSKGRSGNPTSNPGGPPPSSSKPSSSGHGQSDPTMGYGGGDTGSGETHKPGYDSSSPYDVTPEQYTTPGSPRPQNQQGSGQPTPTTPAPPPPPRPPSNLFPTEGETDQQKLDRLLRLKDYVEGGGGNPYNDIPNFPTGETGSEKLDMEIQKLELNLELIASEKRIAEGEESLRGQVTESRIAREEMATSALEAKLEEADIFGMQARQLIGEQQAQRGMLRSTLTGERLEEVGLKEAQFKEGAKLRTKAFKEEGVRQEELMFAERDQIRELAKQNRLYAELDQTINALSDISRFEQRMAHERSIAQAQMSAQQSAGFAGFLGSVVSTVLSVAFFL